MKKLILLLTLTMMFGQDGVSSKFYTVDVNGDAIQWIELNDLTGYNQSWYMVDVIDENAGCRLGFNGGTFNSSDANHRHSGWADFHQVNNFDTSTTTIYLIDSNPRLRIENQYTGCTGEIYLVASSNFPIEDTGYIEDGFDYCVEPGVNLMSYPCDSEVALTDAIPSDALTQFSGIIGQGTAATNLNGTWVGSIINLSPGSGYWIKSNSALCFNYDCSEN